MTYNITSVSHSWAIQGCPLCVYEKGSVRGTAFVSTMSCPLRRCHQRSGSERSRTAKTNSPTAKTKKKTLLVDRKCARESPLCRGWREATNGPSLASKPRCVIRRLVSLLDAISCCASDNSHLSVANPLSLPHRYPDAVHENLAFQAPEVVMILTLIVAAGSAQPRIPAS